MNREAAPSHATPPQPVRIDSETGPLRRVIIGRADTFVMPDPINPKQELFHAEHPERPLRETLCAEFDDFQRTLEAHGVEVLVPNPVSGVPDQLTPRDIGFVVGDTFVVSSMAAESRRREWRGIEPIIDRLPPQRVVRVPLDVTVEGGDIVLDKGTLYVGVSERTDLPGAEFLVDRFGDDYHVEIVKLKKRAEGHDVLHLDCAFVPVGANHALVYPPGFRKVPERIRAYEWIEIDAEEQFHLGTNVLSISPTCVISRDNARRINDELRAIGLEVIELPFDDTPKGGGSFRCASLPLERDGVAALQRAADP